MKREVVIGIADRSRDRDDLASGRAFRLGDRFGDLLTVGIGEPDYHEPDAPPPPNEPPPKPPKLPPPPPPQLLPPPPPQEPPPQPPPREPRLSSLRPHSTTHGLMPP